MMMRLAALAIALAAMHSPDRALAGILFQCSCDVPGTFPIREQMRLCNRILPGCAYVLDRRPVTCAARMRKPPPGEGGGWCSSLRFALGPDRIERRSTSQ